MSLFSSLSDLNSSDQSRGRLRINPRYRGPLLGLVVGLTYGITEWWFDRFGEKAPHILWELHESLDFIIPALIGVLVGVGIHLYQKNKKLNHALSTQNHNLRSRLLANTLLAHILHEIRNPIHNLSALLEKSIHLFSNDDREIAERNLKRLNDTTERLKRISGPWDEISARERTHFQEWLREFINRSVTASLNSFSIRCSESITPFIAHMHPLLLEQCFTILFQNAIHACLEKPGKNQITLKAKPDMKRHGFARVEITNSGAVFSDHVLSAGAHKAVRSTNGMGIGLLLARDTLETVGGALEIANIDGQATVKLFIPAESIL